MGASKAPRLIRLKAYRMLVPGLTADEVFELWGILGDLLLSGHRPSAFMSAECCVVLAAGGMKWFSEEYPTPRSLRGSRTSTAIPWDCGNRSRRLSESACLDVTAGGAGARIPCRRGSAPAPD